MSTLASIAAILRTGASGTLTPTVQPLKIPRGDSIIQPFTVTDEAGAAVNLTGHTITASIGPQDGPPTISVVATITSAVNGTGSFTLTAAQTDLSPVPLYWDLEDSVAGVFSKIVLQSLFIPIGGVYGS